MGRCFTYRWMDGRWFMKVYVHMRPAVVSVFMHMNIGAFPEYSPKSQQSEPDYHQGDTKLQPVSHCFRNGHPEDQNQQANDYKRERVSDALERAHQSSSQLVSMLTNYGRDCHHVIHFHRMLEPEYQTEAQQSYDAG